MVKITENSLIITIETTSPEESLVNIQNALIDVAKNAGEDITRLYSQPLIQIMELLQATMLDYDQTCKGIKHKSK